MALNIRNSETENLANELTRLTGETKTQAVKKALFARLQILKQQQETQHLIEELNEIAEHCATLHVQDNRSGEEIRQRPT